VRFVKKRLTKLTKNAILFGGYFNIVPRESIDFHRLKSKTQERQVTTVDKLNNKETQRLYEAILTLKTADECNRFFKDICTINEIIAISQRLHVAEMLKAGYNYTDITRETGCSTATISRVNRCLAYGEDGYNTVLARLEESDKSAAE